MTKAERELVRHLFEFTIFDGEVWFVFPREKRRDTPTVVQNYPSKDLAELGAYQFLVSGAGDIGGIPSCVDEFV